MTRLSLASFAANGLLLGLVVFLLIGQGKRDETIRGLRDDLVIAADALRKASDDIRDYAAGQGVTATEAARICGAEGSSAFERGRAFGRAEAPVCPATPVS